MSPAVRTVLGDLDPAELGVCDAHDHLFFASRLLPGQELDDVPAAAAELAAFRAAGGGAVVQWTPHGLNRRAAELPALSAAAGVHLVAATGLHRAAHYDELPDPERWAELFTAELTEGIGPDGPRAGLIKVAGGFHGLDGHARRTMAAAAAAHHATGAPIGIHHELGSAADQVLELLCGRLGVPPHRVLLGHLNRFPDPAMHRELARSGAFLAFDGPSRANAATDWRLLGTLVDLVEAGHAGQLLLGGDTTTAAARSAADGPGMPFLLTGLRPRLAAALGEEAVELILRRNPARAFGVDWH
ncbi:phosphotriesterase [Kitasatospora viridis]|uniref:Phosphotriesterase-related protein n=1 Tax=Kitasatospora viridis TaxID=281105 RepID=A0A561UB02_9ACTN|nr:phosphotriesterase [Kitasatospora viridis]TWF96530.1 phosphotriesterase-related protein [Kitasatospora viridis]